MTALARHFLGFVGLGERAHEQAGELPHGQRRLAEIARALIGRPRLLLLDEPAAGLSMTELDKLGALIRSIADLGVTVVIVEHHLELVADICRHVTCRPRPGPRGGHTRHRVRRPRRDRRVHGRAPVGGSRVAGRRAMTALLQVEAIDVGYGHVGVLEDVSLAVEEGSIVALVGSNGAGKSTLLRAISGLLRPRRGRIVFAGTDLAGAAPNRVVDAGILHVAEGRRLFRQQSVDDNLELGLYRVRIGRGDAAARYARVFELFPCSPSAAGRAPACCRAGSSRCWRSRRR